MQKEIFPIAALLALACSLPLSADELALPAAAVAPTITLPAKGSSMAEVEKKFGAPTRKRPSVGGGSPRQPPITRWDYPGFAVVFENDKVIDSVVPGAPPKLATEKGLQADPSAPALPAMSTPEAPATAAPEPMAPIAPMAPAEPDMPAEVAPFVPMEEAPAAPTEMAPEMPAEMPAEMAPDSPASMPMDSSGMEAEPPAEAAPPATEEPQPLP